MNIKLPFPLWTLNADAIVYTVETNKQSEPIKTKLFEGRVNHVKKTKQMLNANRELIMISGWLVIPGDIHRVDMGLDTPLYVEVAGIVKRVQIVNMPDNPDGSIYSTELYF